MERQGRFRLGLVLAVVVVCGPLASAASPSLIPGPVAHDGKLVPVDGQAVDRFGGSVAIDGDTALVAAASGAYVYARQAPGVWTEQAKLADEVDSPVRSVALAGDTALVGTPFPGGFESGEPGTVSIFTNRDGSWEELAQFTVGDGRDAFGLSLAIDGDRALAGAPLDDEHGQRAGAVYVLGETSEGDWKLEGTLVSDDVIASDLFGMAVDLDGEEAVIGTALDAGSPGAAYVFEQESGAWAQEAQLLDWSRGDGGGTADWVAMDGDTVLLGNPRADRSRGEVYVYEEVAEGEWTQQAQLASEERTFGFGRSIDLEGDRALVGAPMDFDPGTVYTEPIPGTAHLFVRTAEGWEEVQTLRSVEPEDHAKFGYAVDLGDGRAIVGEPGAASHGGSSAGSAEVFRSLADG